MGAGLGNTHTEAGMTALHMPNCWICGRSVSVKERKIDENGFPVHESCYVAKLALDKGQFQMSAPLKVLQELITDI
jgi:hypothetical protein